MKSLAQRQKFYKHVQVNKTENDRKKFIFKFSNYELSYAEKTLLAKDFNFCLAPKQLIYIDYLADFKFFDKNISNLEILVNEEKSKKKN